MQIHKLINVKRLNIVRLPVRVLTIFLMMLSASLAMAQGSANDYFDQGNFWHEKGDLDKAIANWSEAVKINPEFANAYHNLGSAWGHKGNFEQAIEYFNKALSIDPQNSITYRARGTAWSNIAYRSRGDVRLRNYSQAISDLNEAIKINPTDADAYYSRGVTWQLQGKGDKAITDYSEALKINPQHAKAKEALNRVRQVMDFLGK